MHFWGAYEWTKEPEQANIGWNGGYCRSAPAWKAAASVITCTSIDLLIFMQQANNSTSARSFIKQLEVFATPLRKWFALESQPRAKLAVRGGYEWWPVYHECGWRGRWAKVCMSLAPARVSLKLHTWIWTHSMNVQHGSSTVQPLCAFTVYNAWYRIWTKKK